VIFVDLYRDELKKPYTSVVRCDFDGYFDQQVRELEGFADKNVKKAPEVFLGDLTPPSSSDNGNDEPPPVPGLLPGKGSEVKHKYSGYTNPKLFV
jgi:signal recognition particle receptor subunit alpha